MRLAALLVFALGCSSQATHPRAPAHYVYSEVVGHNVPELKCEGGTPSRNADGAITGCLGPSTP